MTPADTAFIHALDCALTAFEIRVTLAAADLARREQDALQRWNEHGDRSRLTARDWAVFEARNYAAYMYTRREAVRA